MKRTFMAFAGILLFWEAAALLASLPFLPPPTAVFLELFKQIAGGELLVHLLISLYRVIAALFFAGIPALLLGILSGRNRKVDRIVSPLVYLLFPIPKVALLPIILLFFGLGNAAKIFLVSLIIFFQLFLNIRDEVSGISWKYFDSLISLGGNRTHILFHIIIPAIMPRIFSSVRLSLGTAIAVLFFAETFATRKGIGWFVMDAWARISYQEMYAGIVMLSLAGLLLFGILDLLERRFCRWNENLS